MKKFDRDEHWFFLAQQLFNDMEIFQSITIVGRINDGEQIEIKGRKVWSELCRLDRFHNCRKNSHGKWQYIRKRPKNSSGASLAHKIWRWKLVDEDTEQPRFTIWRIQ